MVKEWCMKMEYSSGEFIWPNPGAIPGVRITAVDLEGQTHTIFEAGGEYGINRLIDSAQESHKTAVLK